MTPQVSQVPADTRQQWVGRAAPAGFDHEGFAYRLRYVVPSA